MSYRFFFCLIFFILTLTSISLPSFASAQSVRCHFTDVSNPDQLLIQFSNDQTGRLSYLVDASGSSSSTSSDPTLTLKRNNKSDKGIASFSTEVTVMQMTFKMPVFLVGKQNSQFQATLSSQIEDLHSNQDQDLSCESLAL